MKSKPIPILLAVCAIAGAGGCKTGASESRAALSIAAFVPVYEDQFSQPGEWEEREGALDNRIPLGTRAEDVLASKDGVGVSLALLRDFDSEDLEIESRVGVTVGSAAGVVFRVAEKDGVVTSMWYYALNCGGVGLWRYENKRWTPVYRFAGVFAEQTPHALTVRVKGNSIRLGVNGNQLPPLEDTAATGGGKAGICAREGFSRIFSFKADAI